MGRKAANTLRSRRNFLKAQGVVAAAGLTGVSGCTGILGGGEEITIRYNAGTPEDSAMGTIVQTTADHVNENATGVTIETFFNGELGGIIESMESVSGGSLGMYTTLFSIGGAFHTPMMAFDAPYLYEDFEHGLEATDPRNSDIMKQAVEGLVEASNIRALGAGVQGIRRTTIAGDPVRHPDDFGDRTMRAVPIDVMFEAVRGLGAEPVEIDFSELPSALATGSVDGQENPYALIVASSLHENQDYVVETNHIHAMLPVYIGEHIWTDLSDSQQDVFYDAVDAAQSASIDYVENAIESAKEKIRNDGVEIISVDDLDLQAFKDNARQHMVSTFPEFSDMWEELSYEPYE